MTHPDHVEGWDGSLQDLAKTICNMKYDKLSEFLREMSYELLRQSENDARKKRNKLSFNIFHASTDILRAASYVCVGWEICKPFMKNNEISKENIYTADSG